MDMPNLESKNPIGAPTQIAKGNDNCGTEIQRFNINNEGIIRTTIDNASLLPPFRKEQKSTKQVQSNEMLTK